MDEDREELIEARRVINKLTLVCRQTIMYLDGMSVLNETRLRNSLHSVINDSNKFMKV